MFFTRFDKEDSFLSLSHESDRPESKKEDKVKKELPQPHYRLSDIVITEDKIPF